MLRSVIETIVIASITEASSATVRRTRYAVFGEFEECATSRLLHALSKCLVAADFNIGDGSSGRLHCLLEMSFGKFRNWILAIFFLLHVDVFAGSFTSLTAFDVRGDGLLDGELDRSLGDEAQIG